MRHGYRTLAGAASDSFVEKKSRFIGHGSPAASEDDALRFLAEIREQYKDASHNCYAYIIGRNAGIMRYSDDGEPGGTAGQPILECMRACGVVNCTVVVTRYFGGVLLGAGGLTRAYAHGAKLALDAARIIVIEDSVRFWAGVDYALWGRVEHWLKTAPVRNEGMEFGATVTATLITRQRDRDAVFAALVALCEGKIELLEIEPFTCGWDEPSATSGDSAPS